MKKILFVIICMFGVYQSHAQAYNFESTWQTFNVIGTSLTRPLGWSCTDSLIVGYGKITNPFGTYNAQCAKVAGHTGSWAVQVNNKYQDGISIAGIPAKVMPGAAFNSLISIDQTSGGILFDGGLALNSTHPISTSMWIKTSCVGGDTTYIDASLFDNSDGSDSLVGGVDTFFVTDINTWQKITLHFNYTTALDPTILRYTIASSGINALFDSATVVHDGTSISVDDIEINYPSGVSQQVQSAKIINIHPTVVTNTLYANFVSTILDNSSLVITDIFGRSVSKISLNNTNNKLDLNSLISGVYMYNLYSNNELIQVGKFVKE